MHPVKLHGVLAAILSIAGCLYAEQGQGTPPGEGGTGPHERMTQMLADARAASTERWPQLKKRMLAGMQGRLEQQNGSNPQAIAAAIAEAGKILDDARALPDDQYKTQQELCVIRLMQTVATGLGRIPNGGNPPNAKGQGQPDVPPTTALQWIDVHDHLVGGPQHDFVGAVKYALTAMDEAGIKRMIVMPPPSVTGMAGNRTIDECDRFIEALKPHAARFAFLGGGASLNAMLQQAAQRTAVSDSQRRQFEQKANELLRMGLVGFGEMAVHHLSLHGEDHPYESVSADHPLLLLLADIAAAHDVPIDIHFDVVTEEIPVPEWLTSTENPKVLHANLAAFERLLEHNPKTRICWAHAGSDNTGHWTTDLTRKLLGKHPNLYMSLRMGPGHVPQNHPLTAEGKLKPEWLALFRDFPTRFVIGNDRFLASTSFKTQGMMTTLANKPIPPNTRLLLAALPTELAQKLASENALALYKLKE